MYVPTHVLIRAFFFIKQHLNRGEWGRRRGGRNVLSQHTHTHTHTYSPLTSTQVSLVICDPTSFFWFAQENPLVYFKPMRRVSDSAPSARQSYADLGSSHTVANSTRSLSRETAVCSVGRFGQRKYTSRVLRRYGFATH